MRNNKNKIWMSNEKPQQTNDDYLAIEKWAFKFEFFILKKEQNLSYHKLIRTCCSLLNKKCQNRKKLLNLSWKMYSLQQNQSCRPNGYRLKVGSRRWPPFACFYNILEIQPSIPGYLKTTAINISREKQIKLAEGQWPSRQTKY